MEAKIFLGQGVFDNAENIKKTIEKGEKFQLKIYDESDDCDGGFVGLWIENVDESKEATMMFSLDRKQAVFLGNLLLSFDSAIAFNKH